MKSYSTYNTRGVAHLVVPFSENILEKLPHDIDAYMVADIIEGGVADIQEVEDIAEEMKYRDQKYAEENRRKEQKSQQTIENRLLDIKKFSLFLGLP